VFVAQLAARLDELQHLLMHAPLLRADWTGEPSAATPAEEPPNTVATPAPSDEEAENIAAPQPWWTKAWVATRNGAHQAWQLVYHDLRQLVSIRRIDDPNALLMNAEQATQLREHLRMRIMMARLALMTAQTHASNNTQTRLWQTEMQAIQNVIQARFDLHTRTGLQAFNLAGQLAQTSVALDLPHTLNSQQAIQTLTEILQARATGRQADAPVITATSDVAVLDQDGDRVAMRGNARVHRSGDAQAPAMQIESDALTLLISDDVVFTDAPAIVVRGHSVMRGTGMHYDNKTKTLQVHAAVDVRIAGRDQGAMSAESARGASFLPRE